MEKSESITNLFQALSVFHVKMEAIPKTGNNPFFNSKYPTMKCVQDAIATPLLESELEISQFPTGNYGITNILVHIPSGEYIMDTF